MIAEYEIVFKDVHNIIQNRNQSIQNELEPNGVIMHEAITKILVSAHEDNDDEASYYAAKVEEDILLGRLYVNKFIKSSKSVDYDFAMSKLTADLNEQFTLLNNAVQNSQRRALLSKYSAAYKQYMVAVDFIHSQQMARNDKVYNILDLVGPKFANLVQDVNNISAQKQDALGPAVEASNVRNIAIISVMGVFAVLASIVLATLVTRGVLQGVLKAVHAADQIASGNLNLHLRTENTNEIATLLNALQKTADSLKTIVGSLSNAGQALKSESVDLELTTDRSSTDMGHLQERVEFMSISMNEMAQTIQEIASNASDAAVAAHVANEKSNEGQGIVENTISSITLLETEVLETVTSLKALSEKSDDIGGILNVIRSIAEQTNLLALNAAIEAARAGEQGRGFAVVADEVRGLAKRTQDATQEINQLIQDLQEGTLSAVKAMDKSKTLVDSSVSAAKRSGESLKSITNAIDEINGMNAMIATASEEQSSVASQIKTNVNDIETISQTNSGHTSVIVKSSHKLKNVSAELGLIIGRFKI